MEITAYSAQAYQALAGTAGPQAARAAEDAQAPAKAQAPAADSFQGIASGWNIHSMSQADTEAMSLQLYEAGHISLAEHAMLSFDYDRAITDLMDQGLAGPDATIDGVGLSEDGARDLMDDWTARLDFRRKNGLPTDQAEDMVALLRKLDSARVLGSGMTV